MEFRACKLHSSQDTFENQFLYELAYWIHSSNSAQSKNAFFPLRQFPSTHIHLFCSDINAHSFCHFFFVNKPSLPKFNLVFGLYGIESTNYNRNLETNRSAGGTAWGESNLVIRFHSSKTRIRYSCPVGAVSLYRKFRCAGTEVWVSFGFSVPRRTHCSMIWPLPDLSAGPRPESRDWFLQVPLKTICSKSILLT